MKYVIAAGLLMLMGACATSNGSSAYTETGAICDNAGLESQLVRLRDQSRTTAAALGAGTGEGAGVAGYARNQADVERAYQLRDKLNRFDAEVDVQFRTLTSSCKAYSRCMEKRRYREAECSSSMARWRASETEFASLSRELRQIEAEVEKARIASQRRHRSECRGDNCGRPRLKKSDPCDCTSSVGGVFSSCCSTKKR